MKFSAQQIATLLQGTLEGDSDVLVSRLAKIEEGDSESLCFLSNPKYEHHLYTSQAAIVVINESQLLAADRPIQPTLIRVPDAYQAFAELLKIYDQMRSDRTGREEFSVVHESAKVGADCYVGAFAYVGKQTEIGNNVKIYPQVYIGDNVRIGDNTTLYPGVKVYHDCVLGAHVTVHAGAVVGSDGFGFAPQKDGTYSKVPQIGNVIIEDHVEIGSNTVVDRATLGSTVLKKGVKLDNLVQIAHNVEVGSNTVIAAQTGVSGSTKVGAQVILGGQVGVVGHITLAKGIQVQAQSGVNKTIKEENSKWGGSPAFPYQGELRSQVLYAKLPQLEKRIAELEKQLRDK